MLRFDAELVNIALEELQLVANPTFDWHVRAIDFGCQLAFAVQLELEGGHVWRNAWVWRYEQATFYQRTLASSGMRFLHRHLVRSLARQAAYKLSGWAETLLG